MDGHDESFSFKEPWALRGAEPGRIHVAVPGLHLESLGGVPPFLVFLKERRKGQPRKARGKPRKQLALLLIFEGKPKGWWSSGKAN